MSDGLKEVIFEPFRQGDDPHPSGTGIGLSLVSKFAQLHGGKAWVEDRPGGGACFNVSLPDSEIEVGAATRSNDDVIDEVLLSDGTVYRPSSG